MFYAPSHAGLPHFLTLLDDLPGTPRQIARHLGISEATLKRYRREGQAPRAIMLALFWESSWGRRTADAVAFNHATAHAALAVSLKRSNMKLRQQIAQLEAAMTEIDGHAANAPIFNVG